MLEVLQFGGGRDSLACLYLLREKWPTLVVAWMNTGAAFPETIEQMEHIKALVPNFLEIRSDVLTDIEKNGWPSDVVPMRNTGFGKECTGETGIKMRSWWNCCMPNFWAPMHQKMIDIGATRVYRGQRLSEDYKSPLRGGQNIDGIEYLMPLENWTQKQVSDYLASQGVAEPAHYKQTDKSLDCWCCTAYLDAKLDQLSYLKDNHGKKFRIVIEKIVAMNEAVNKARAPLSSAAMKHSISEYRKLVGL